MKKYYVILNILSSFFILVAGIRAGMLWQNTHIIKEDAYEERHGTDIAVVNQDLGIPVDDQTINYANAVIETLGSDYTVVSLSAAETGLDNGTYGAVVTFPADFSENILSINQSNPEQAVLDLAVSKRLPEDSYISLYTKLIGMEQRINNNMAYAYVESVFGELHSAQDDVKELLANDETDMKAVEKVHLAKYIEMLDLGDIPKVEFNPESPDFEALLAKVQTIADDMNQVYVDSYAAAQADYSEVQKQISDYEKTITDQSESWIKAMNDWTGGVSGYKKNLDNWRTSAEANRKKYNNAVDAYNSELDTYLATQYNGLISSRDDFNLWVEGEIDKITNLQDNTDSTAREIHDKAENCQTYISNYNTEIANLQEWAKYIEDYKEYINDPNLDEPNEPAVAMPSALDATDALRELRSFSEDIDAIFTGYRESIEEIQPYTGDIHIIQPFEGDKSEIENCDISEVPDAQDGASPDDVPAHSAELTEALKGIVSVSAGYNPDEYFDDKTKEKAQQYVTKYSTHLDAEKSEMESKNGSNLQQLTTAYQAYNKHVGDLRLKITEVHTKEQENLQKRITELTDTLKKTSKANHVLMDSFVDRMPNSRNESTVNQAVVEATVTPVGYVYDYVRVAKKKAETYSIPWLLPLLIAILLAMLLISIMAVIKKRQLRRSEARNEI